MQVMEVVVAMPRHALVRQGIADDCSWKAPRDTTRSCDMTRKTERVDSMMNDTGGERMSLRMVVRADRENDSRGENGVQTARMNLMHPARPELPLGASQYRPASSCRALFSG
jgi:hypothetical protein